MSAVTTAISAFGYRPFAASVGTGIATEVRQIAKKVVIRLPTLEPVPIASFWQDRPVVICFFRQWGCKFTRQGAVQMSNLAPLLQSHGVRLVGIGFETEGWEDFIESEYFTGELFLDEKLGSYKALEFKEWSYCSMICSFMNPKALGLFLARDGIPANFRGAINGFQSGGCVIVAEGGKQVLLFFRQPNPSVHVPNEDVLRVLSIDPTGGSKQY